MLPEALLEPIFLYYQLNEARRFQLLVEGLVFLLPKRFPECHISKQILYSSKLANVLYKNLQSAYQISQKPYLNLTL